jgi:hypothetical protein
VGELWRARYEAVFTPSLEKGMHRVELLTDQQLKDDWRGVAVWDASRFLR